MGRSHQWRANVLSTVYSVPRDRVMQNSLFSLAAIFTAIAGLCAAAPAQTAEGPPVAAKTVTAEADPIIGESKETVEIPDGRPKWIGSEPNLRGKIHTIAV